MSKPIPTALILKCEETERRTIYELGHMGVTASPTIEGCIELAKKVIEKNKNGPYQVSDQEAYFGGGEYNGIAK